MLRTGHATDALRRNKSVGNSRRLIGRDKQTWSTSLQGAFRLRLLWRARRETERTEPHSLGVVTGIIYIYIYRNSSVHNGSKSVSCDKGTLAVRSSLTQRRMIYGSVASRHDNIVTIGSGVKMCTPTRRPESPDAGHNSIHGHGGAGHGYHVLLKRVSAFTRHATRSCRFHTDHSPTQTRRKGDTSPPTDTESGRPAALHKAGAPRG